MKTFVTLTSAIQYILSTDHSYLAKMEAISDIRRLSDTTLGGETILVLAHTATQLTEY